MSGVMSVTGEPGGQAVLTGVPIADFTAALLGVQAILLALSARERTGRGQKADVSMLSGLLLSLTTRLATHWATGEDPRAFGSSHSIVTPYQAFATKDGQVVAGVWGNEGWPRFCKAIQRPDLAADPRFTENVDRMKLRDELEPILNEVFLTKTTVEWEKSFREEQALFGPVYKFSEILNHPHIQQAGLLQSVDHPKLGPLKQLGPVIEFSETPGRISGPPPLHGEHTVDVLSSELGLTETQIQSLVESGVIKDGRLHAEPRPE
jgi:formyl-CoA transferase/CoA:oxalate CoA-transferase